MKSILIVSVFILVFNFAAGPIGTVSADRWGAEGSSVDSGLEGPGGFVTCEGAGCSACNLVEMVNLLIKWLFGVIFLIFAALMAVAGFGLVTSGGNQSALEAAKSKFQNAVVGAVIVMSAWLVINTIMQSLVGGGTSGSAVGEIDGWGPWSTVKCQVQTTPQPWSRTGMDIPAGTSAVVTPPGTIYNSESHNAAVASLGSNFIVSSSGTCSDKTLKECTSLDGIKELTITRVKELQSVVGGTFIVTGGTETGHAPGDYSHGTGYKIDLRPEPALNSYIENTYTAAGSNRWKDTNGNVYYRHGPPDHWDLTITN